MTIFSHRGIDLDLAEPMAENSLLAFRRAAVSGQGIELDLQMSADRSIVLAHDPTAHAWSRGRSAKPWSQMSDGEIFLLENQYGPLARLQQVLALGEEFPKLRLALHLKGANQTPALVKRLIEILARQTNLHERILIFDVKPEVGALIRRSLRGIGVAASVAHDYDISRFQKLTDGTLMSAESLMMTQGIYDWAWLDEWDRQGRKNSTKSLYSEDLTAQLRRRGLRTVLVSPELHRSERHVDGLNLVSLQKRWADLNALGADAICTDYPARLSSLFKAG